ncbi:MAG TPA: MgtC/SapB family protein [Bryobacteraceae bacterium]|nr:MgtC/SapB family protein [Bryobacteraceae bacterium]
MGPDWGLLADTGMRIALAYLLALPIGWDREREGHTGVRTFPLVAIASCGYVLLGGVAEAGLAEGQSRIIQGLITGIGFIGAGAILKGQGSVYGSATAASIWNTGVVGAAVALGRFEIAVILSAINLLTLRLLPKLKSHIVEERTNGEPGKDN